MPSGVAVAGVADELLVPQAGAVAAGDVLGEDGDHGADHVAFALAGEAQVAHELLEDLVGRRDLAQVAHDEAAPVEPADAAARVAPRDPAAEDQFGVRVGVGARLGDLVGDPREAFPDVASLWVLPVVLVEEILCLPRIHGQVRNPTADLACRGIQARSH